jgi:adenosyl cobinamide kinase/adenosyl cobinamide phosphate guanylyltransferase
MLRLITGPNDSGKSVFAEELFSRAPGPKRYLATLPDLAQHAERIQRHQLRRPDDWVVHELSGFLQDDVACFRACVRERAAVLLDGFSIYLRRLVLFESAERAATLAGRAGRLIVYLGSVCPEVIVVDCPAGEDEAGRDVFLRTVSGIAEAAGELTRFDERGLREVISRSKNGER